MRGSVTLSAAPIDPTGTTECAFQSIQTSLFFSFSKNAVQKKQAFMPTQLIAVQHSYQRGLGKINLFLPQAPKTPLGNGCLYVIPEQSSYEYKIGYFLQCRQNRVVLYPDSGS